VKIAFIGCVEFSKSSLELLASMDGVDLVGLVTLKGSSFNSDFRDLTPIAHEIACPTFFDEKDDEATAGFLRSVSPDVVYCFGWSRLLGPKVLASAPLGVVGFHPAMLPSNRGRHPIVWAIALGLTTTGSSFFMMVESADAGDIISQVEVPVTSRDDARSLYKRITQVAMGQIRSFTPMLASSAAARTPQDHGVANSWRRRNHADGRIDWRMSTAAIIRLVRALAPPYIGAHCVVRGQDSKVWKAVVGPEGDRNIEPGKVLESDENGVLVKCDDGTILIVDHGFSELPKVGSYL